MLLDDFLFLSDKKATFRLTTFVTQLFSLPSYSEYGKENGVKIF